MIILKTEPLSNGAYSNQSWPDNIDVPEGYIAVPKEFKSTWTEYAPFVTLTVKDGVITAIADNAEARAAQETSEATLAPSIEDRVSAIEDALLILL